MPHRSGNPRVTVNPFFNQNNQSRTPTGLGRLGAHQQPQQREDINIQIARSLLLDPNISATRKTRLRGIISANSPVDRRRLEQLEDRARGRLGSFFDENQTTADEEQQLTEQFQAAFPNSLAPAPRQLRRAHEDRESPESQLANVAQTQAKKYGVDPDYVLSLNGLDKDTGQVDYKHALAVDKHLSQQGQASPGQTGSVKTELSRIDKELKALREDPTLFDERSGARLDPLELGFFGSSQSAIDLQSFKFTQLDRLERERAGLVRRQQGFVTSFDQPTPTPTAEPEPTITVPKATPQFSTTEPYALQPSDNPADIARDAQEQARRDGVTYQVIDPTTGIIYEFK